MTVFREVRVFDGDMFLDEPHDVVVEDGLVTALHPSPGSPLRTQGTDVVREGGVLFPGFVDAHVHLSFASPGDVARGGITTVLDLGAPWAYAEAPHPPLRVRYVGPLLTARGGYPTRSWGRNGYGREIASPDDARRAVGQLADGGVAMIKVALEPREGPTIDDDTLRAVTDAAHRRGLLVAAHALDPTSVRRAAAGRVDVLGHTPTGQLDDGVIGACADRPMTIVSTVRAFGDEPRTRENLRALHDAGCDVVYGTDLGNGDIRPGIDVDELRILEELFGDREDTLSAASRAAGDLVGGGGSIEVGAPADLVWVPRFDEWDDLAGPLDVFIDGKLIT